MPGPLAWDGPDESVAQVMRHLVLTKEVWLAAIGGEDFPDLDSDAPVELARRHEKAAPRWLALVRDILAGVPGATASSTPCANRPRVSCWGA